MNFIFKEDISKTIEVYVDDLIIKSRTLKDHFIDLERVLQKLDQHKVKLNPDKCVFRVKVGKFLGFMILQRGIEANPKKMEAIINIKAPITLNESQKLNGRITILGKFMSCSTKKCLPFFRVMKNVKKFKWNADCQVAFEDIKNSTENLCFEFEVVLS